MLGKRQMRPSSAVRTVWGCRSHRHLAPRFPANQKIATIHASSGFIRGIPIKTSYLEGLLISRQMTRTYLKIA